MSSSSAALAALARRHQLLVRRRDGAAVREPRDVPREARVVAAARAVRGEARALVRLDDVRKPAVHLDGVVRERLVAVAARGERQRSEERGVRGRRAEVVLPSRDRLRERRREPSERDDRAQREQRQRRARPDPARAAAALRARALELELARELERRARVLDPAVIVHHARRGVKLDGKCCALRGDSLQDRELERLPLARPCRHACRHATFSGGVLRHGDVLGRVRHRRGRR